MSETQVNRLFPVFLKLEELNLLIVGGGKVGLEKLSAVRKNSPGCKITLVSKAMDEFSEIEGLEVRRKAFEESDLDGQDVVIIAVGDVAEAEKIRAAAKKRKLLVNVADKPELCDFYLGSVVQKGELKIAISTNGKSPTLAKRVKETLDGVFPDETQSLLNNLSNIRSKLSGDFSSKVKRLDEITAVLVEENNEASIRPHYVRDETRKPKYKQVKYWLIYSLASLGLMVVGHLLFTAVPFETIGGAAGDLLRSVDREFLLFVLGGFIAQMVDGALGMAYGVSATTFLLSFGIPPAAASASVHASEIFTTGASGLMHLKFKNVNTKLFRHLLLPGIAGAILGAYILSSLEQYADYIKPVVSVYTLILGVIIIVKAIRKAKKRSKVKRVGWLAGAGAFLDSIGGGGWGPIVASTLIARGRSWKYTIGSVNLAEFFVTFASSITFFILIGLDYWYVILGLVIGGMIAAPIAAYLTSKIPVKAGLILVGTVVIIVSLRILILSFI